MGLWASVNVLMYYFDDRWDYPSKNQMLFLAFSFLEERDSTLMILNSLTGEACATSAVEYAKLNRLKLVRLFYDLSYGTG